MPSIDHNSDISIYNMVRNRLKFLADSPTNTTLVSNFTLEVMWELEPCFKVGNTDVGYDEDRIGHEEYYSVPQQSIIADIVSVYILLIEAAASVGASSGSSTTVGTFLKRAKAGSAEVEYDSFDKDSAAASGSYLSMMNLIDQYKQSAVRKAAKLNCYFSICDDCTIQYLNSPSVPFVVAAPSNGCGCGS